MPTDVKEKHRKDCSNYQERRATRVSGPLPGKHRETDRRRRSAASAQYLTEEGGALGAWEGTRVGCARKKSAQDFGRSDLKKKLRLVRAQPQWRTARRDPKGWGYWFAGGRLVGHEGAGSISPVLATELTNARVGGRNSPLAPRETLRRTVEAGQAPSGRLLSLPQLPSSARDLPRPPGRAEPRPHAPTRRA